MAEIFNNKGYVWMMILGLIAVLCGALMAWVQNMQELADRDTLCFIPLFFGFLFVYLFFRQHQKMLDARYGEIKEE